MGQPKYLSEKKLLKQIVVNPDNGILGYYKSKGRRFVCIDVERSLGYIAK